MVSGEREGSIAPRLRLLAALAVLCSASLLLLTARAEAFTACTSGGGTLNVSMTGEEDAAEIERFGDQIAVVAIGDGPEVLVACSGGTPTVTNTDTINVSKSPGNDYDGGLRIDLSKGPFSPGASPEADGTPEIEFAVTTAGEDATFLVIGTDGPDAILAGTTAGGTQGFNFNPLAEGTAPDADLIFSGAAAVGVRGEGGNDILSGAGGPGFAAPLRPAVFEVGGGDGNDKLAAGPRGSYLFGGDGRDSMIGAEGRDIMLGGDGRDSMIGGPGRDAFLADGKDGKDLIDCGPGRDFTESPGRVRPGRQSRRGPRDKRRACENLPVPRRAFQNFPFVPDLFDYEDYDD